MTLTMVPHIHTISTLTYKGTYIKTKEPHTANAINECKKVYRVCICNIMSV